MKSLVLWLFGVDDRIKQLETENQILRLALHNKKEMYDKLKRKYDLLIGVDEAVKR